MINVTLRGEMVTVRPSTLHSYIERTEYIKSRRLSPIDSLKDIPAGISEDNYKTFVEIAISASMRMSSVTLDEECAFEASWEGLYYKIYASLKDHFKWDATEKSKSKRDSPLTASQLALRGIDLAQKYYESLSPKEKTSLGLAIRGVDERNLAKNSECPSLQEEPGESQPLNQLEESLET